MAADLARCRFLKTSVDDLFVDRAVKTFQMRDFQGSHGLNRRAQDFLGTAVLSLRSSQVAQDAQDLCSIESMSFTMLAEAHGMPHTRRLIKSYWNCKSIGA